MLLAFHDSGAAAWTIVAAYAAAAALAFAAARQSGSNQLLWWIATTVLIVLGFNKQLDLQTELTFLLRRVSHSEGWYGNRRLAEACFVMGLAALIAASGVTLRRLVRPRSRADLVAVAGLSLIATYGLMRAAKFYHLLGEPAQPTSGDMFNVAFELAGIIVVGGAALGSLFYTRGIR